MVAYICSHCVLSKILVSLRIGTSKVDCEFKVCDILGEEGNTCHAFNYGVHLAQDYADRNITADLASALIPTPY